MPYIQGAVTIANVATNGVAMAAYKASRFAGSIPPPAGTTPPASPDATSTSGTVNGADGAWVLNCPTAELYCVSATLAGVTGWGLYPATYDVNGFIAAPVRDTGGGEYNANGYPGIDPTGSTVSTTAMQTLLDLVGGTKGGGRIILPQKLKIDAALSLKYPGVDVEGSTEVQSHITQATDNVPIWVTGSEDVWGVGIRNVWHDYANVQPKTNTGAIMLRFGITGGIGDGWYHWDVKRCRFTNGQTAIGIAGTGKLPVWNCNFEDLLLGSLSSRLLYMKSPTAIGMPVCTYKNFKAMNNGVAMCDPALAAIYLSAQEAQFDGYGLEDIAGPLVYSDGGVPVSLRGGHVERWGLSDPNGGDGFSTSDGPMTITDLTVAGSINPDIGVNLFRVGNSGGSLFLGEITNSLVLTPAATGFRTLLASGGPVFIRHIVENGTAHTFADASTLALIKQWDTTFYGGLALGNNAGAVGSSLYSGSGAPAGGLGNNGDAYLRTDGGAGTTLYQKRAGSWVATGA